MDKAESDGAAVAGVRRFVSQGCLTLLCIGLLIVTLWLVTRPYPGIIHDSRFYTIEALNQLLPGRFADDLYFRYGSQGQFTLFTPIYKPFLTMFGLAGGNMVLDVIAQCCWLGGLFYLAWTLFRERKVTAIAMAAAILLPSGPFFQYGESFLTPRPFAEAFTFAALGLMLTRRPLRAALLLCVSMTIHPLMTLPGVAVLFVYEAIRRPILWGAPLLGLATTFALAFSGIQPFARLLATMDPQWFEVGLVRNYYCFVTAWGIGEWVSVCSTFALATLAWTVIDPGQRRFLGSALVVAVGGIAITLIGGDFLHNVLIIDIQAWRAIWILAVVAHLLVASVFFRLKKRGEAPLTNAVTSFGIAMALFVLSRFLGPISLGAAAMTVTAGLVGAWEQHFERSLPYVARILALIGMGLSLALAILGLYLFIHPAVPTSSFGHPLRDIGMVAAASIMLVAIFFANAGGRNRVLRSIGTPALSLTLLAVACFNWDQRTPWKKFVDSTETPPMSLTSLLPAKSPIYWEGDVAAAWFLLKRASYFSCEQGTGVLFSRGTAINYQRRFDDFRPLHTLDFGPDGLCPEEKNNSGIPLSTPDLIRICRDETDLAALVLTEPVINAPRRVWIAPAAFEADQKTESGWREIRTNKFYIYPCSSFRR